MRRSVSEAGCQTEVDGRALREQDWNHNIVVQRHCNVYTSVSLGHRFRHAVCLGRPTRLALPVVKNQVAAADPAHAVAHIPQVARAHQWSGLLNRVLIAQSHLPAQGR